METMYKSASDISPKQISKFQIKSQNLKDDLELINIRVKKNNGVTEVKITSSLLEESNYQISIKGQKIFFILSEKKEIARPIYMHNLKWNMITNTNYERLHSYELDLPKANYIIKNTHFNKNKQSVYILLGLKFNEDNKKINRRLKIDRRN